MDSNMSPSQSQSRHQHTLSSSSFSSDQLLTVPPFEHYDSASSSAGDSPGAEFSPDDSGMGGGQLRRSVSASSAGGRKSKHVSQACDACKKKKTKCISMGSGQACKECSERGEDCRQTAKDNRKTPSKQYVATLERERDLQKQRIDALERQTRDLRTRTRAYEERLRAAGQEIEHPASSGPARQLTITIPRRKETEFAPGQGHAGHELVSTGERLIRDDQGRLSAFSAPSPLAHLPSAPQSPPALLSAMPPPLGWSSVALPPGAQLAALDGFFAASGTELLPLRAHLLLQVQRALPSDSFPIPSGADDALGLTPALYNALLATALPFYPPPPSPSSPVPSPSVPAFFAQQVAADLPELFRTQSLANVLALGLMAGYHAGAGEHDVGWQYAGMSARMMQSLGLHLDFSRRARDPAWAGVSQEERRLRNIVYWIVFIQDKLWSMWLGRAVAVAESEDIPLPAAAPNNEPELIFREMCKLMRLANKIMPNVYGADRTTDSAVINNCRLGLDTWFEHLPDLLRPSPKAMESASLALRHLHLAFQWLKLLLDRPFYRPIAQQQLSQEDGVKRCDAALRQIIHLLQPWDRPGLPLAPLGAQIVLSTGITWLQSAVAFHRHSKKRKDEGIQGARTCLRLLRDQGAVMPCARQFYTILRRLMRNYFSSMEIEGVAQQQQQQQQLVQPINIPLAPPMAGPSPSADFHPQPAQLFSEPSSSLGAAGPGSYSPFEPGSISPLPAPSLAANYVGPDTDMIHDMQQYLADWTHESQFEPEWVGIVETAEPEVEMDMFGMEGLTLDHSGGGGVGMVNGHAGNGAQFRQQYGEQTLMPGMQLSNSGGWGLPSPHQ